MNSVQESKNELEAAIRYAENAISSAQGTIESMEFRQEMAKKQYAEQTGREQALEAENAKLREDKERLTGLEIQLRDKVQGQYDDIVQLERDLTAKTAQANAWKKEYDELKAKLEEGKPAMPVIPKDVAIAIFREGVQSGINDAVAELEGQTINICENEYCGDFEVTFARDIHLDDELDLDWMRGKVGQYEESFVVDALKGLCADKDFECRIHGIDDNTIDLTKKND